ncbi:MAG: DUF4147 domain-containing protein [Candidatus Micrarchaeota archaeon]|nr:DUF4147 domain-containing protein [Candidatus Micrarchaeota archaeon]MDE1847361.1 DUF4147 domain-containing protein [Candidatus Micrarchaeota archaeon]MDE1863976.1 DUF4147 domain-containing protein [Candidatus Micrarchaeota archaeon]
MKCIVKNRKELCAGSDYGTGLILDCFEHMLVKVMPESMMRSNLRLNGGILTIRSKNIRLDLDSYERICVYGTGKAGAQMSMMLEGVIGAKRISEGYVTVPKGSIGAVKVERIKLIEAGHPVPDKNSVKGGVIIQQMLKKLGPRDLAIGLISGGGSAQLEVPAPGISLEQIIKTTQMLLAVGANINEINCVRKHLSQIKGGGLVPEENNTTMITLAISDVVGSDLGSLASGPTYPDWTTYAGAYGVLKGYNILYTVPEAVFTRLKKGMNGNPYFEETPKPGDYRFEKVKNVLIGDNRLGCESGIKYLRKNYPRMNIHYLGSDVTGDARTVGRELAARFLDISEGRPNAHLRGITAPCMLIWGGETTVNIKGNGYGGRNQEEAGGTMEVLKGNKYITVGYLSTDGRDGRSEATGAIASKSVYLKALRKGLDIDKALSNNDSNTFFKNAGGAVVTGLTGTNTNDWGFAYILRVS